MSFAKLKELLRARVCTVWLPCLAVLLVLVAKSFVFLIVPNERIMGAVQRIFYFHVSSAISAYAMIGVLFLASILYLRSRLLSWDLIARAAASVALLFCTVVLASGMIWAQAAWNTWWRWEPRLVSFLALWLMLFAYEVLGSFLEEDSRRGQLLAVIGILSAINIPVVVFSVKLLDHSQQLHPQVMENRGLEDARYVYALFVSGMAVLSLATWFLIVRLKNLVIRERIRQCVLEGGA